MKELIIVRGLPGSGKTTFARKIVPNYFEADQFFTIDGVYIYNREKIGEAHKLCQDRTLAAMNCGQSPIVVSNTFVKRWEIAPYLDMAKLKGYQVTEVTMSGPLYTNVHDVPEEVINKMRENWEK